MRIVVKVGSSQLTEAGGKIAVPRIQAYVALLEQAVEAGHTVVLVTSGAIAAGFEGLGYSERPTAISAKQACAAVGQGLLIHHYAEAFSQYGRTVAQVLLSRRDFTFRQSYNNALNTLELLLERGALPIINENDTVAVEEIAFGDNDILAALVGALLHADQVLLLTDVAGLYDSDPRTNPAARLIARVSKITPELLALAGGSGSGSKVGTGGMLAKLRAARVASHLGVPLFVGRVALEQSRGILDIIAGRGAGTYFECQRESMKRKEQWIAFHAESAGVLLVDAGAERALTEKGSSLLAAGIQEVQGNFAAGAVVEILGANARLLGRGVVNYAADDLRKIKGTSTQAFADSVKGRKAEVIHRDEWVDFTEFE